MLMRTLHILALLIAALQPPLIANAEQVSEYELKTAYLYNFALFVTWPAENGKAITICTIGEDRFGSSIEQLHNRKVRNKHLVVRRAIDLEQAPACHMLYIAESERHNMPVILESLRGSSVLTISDAPFEGAALKEEGDVLAAAVSAGMPLRSIITLILENKKLMFEVDSAAAKQAGLTMSSRLLFLAKRVY